MANVWRLYTTTIPSISGYEMDKGYIVNKVLHLESISGGEMVSKIFSPIEGRIFYINTAMISAYVNNGIFTPPSSGNFLVTENGDFLVTENGDRLII